MNNLPGASDLLAIARETLVKEVLPGASGDARYKLLMIANAMAIAAREGACGAPPLSADEEKALARDIRAGRYDAVDEKQRAMLEKLRESVVHRLGISNPRAIE